MKKIIIAIDGPAASGKSTTAKALAKRLGYTYIDTGAMYRAITLKFLRSPFLDELFSNEARLRELLDNTNVHLEGEKVFLDNENVSDLIRSNEVSRLVSKVSSLKLVRDKLTEYQRRIGAARGVVMDGRDIGTVIFPDAELKIFMTASVKERARRRYEELLEKSPTGSLNISIAELEEEIAQRDKADAERPISPMRQAPDAIALDTSDLSIDEQVDFIYRHAMRLIGEHS
ncbi:MAG: (d)CMP kinase [Chloroherpetonaceae bacterium]|nr:(d)CMP kinase [Chloroherpetonaceae bacterium]MDW8020341.1 (d)CMP kinase [Chloroherpetonaceae bacterium]MDW8467449.1 (d)CMP kinase [Chloroherpetonaceae bacterium]